MRLNLTRVFIGVVIATSALSLYTARGAMEFNKQPATRHVSIPSETTKKAVLLMAYELNDKSMVYWGGLDLSLVFDRAEEIPDALK